MSVLQRHAGYGNKDFEQEVKQNEGEYNKHRGKTAAAVSENDRNANREASAFVIHSDDSEHDDYQSV